jgi:2-methylcitrate dehydratase
VAAIRSPIQIVALYNFQDLSDKAVEQIKIHVLNTIGVAIGALDAEPIAAIARPPSELGGRPVSPLTGAQVARLAVILISWTVVSPKARPSIRSDNLGTVLARAEMGGASGTDFLTGLGGRLSSPDTLERCRVGYCLVARPASSRA